VVRVEEGKYFTGTVNIWTILERIPFIIFNAVE
jgi:hypothetical protein